MGLDIVELFIAIESEFSLRIPDAVAAEMTTIGALYEYVARNVAPESRVATGGPYAGELWERFLDVVQRETGVKRDRLRRDARFVQDLALD